MTREETMRVIAEGVNSDSVRPRIDDIGKQAAYGFELAREYAFENDEDEILLDLMMRLYIDDKYRKKRRRFRLQLRWEKHIRRTSRSWRK